MKCFYHSSDLDGFCSGAIVKHKHPEVKLIPINYGQEFPWGDIVLGETVYMVDFSLDMDDMALLGTRTNLIWIDHHKTHLDKADERKLYFEGLRRDGIGACALVWEYLYSLITIPYAVKLLAEWDVWDHHDVTCKPFQYGMRVAVQGPENDLWSQLFDDTYRQAFLEVLAQGSAIVKYEEQSNAMKAKGLSFETEIDGLRGIAINQMYTNSTIFDSVWDEDKYDVMITFGWCKGQWIVSLYATKGDVSHVALRYGGGGHARACGFSCEKLPFKLGESKNG